MPTVILRVFVRNRRAILETCVLALAGITGCILAEILYRLILPFAGLLPE